VKKYALILLLTGSFLGCATSREADHRAHVISQTLTSTVQLLTVRTDGARRAGSGVVLGPAGESGHTFILTTKHLFTPVAAQTVRVVDPLRRKQAVAKIIAISEELDLALLEVGELTLTPVELKAEARLGDPIWVIAFPWGRRRTVVSGVVSQISWDNTKNNAVPIRGPVALIDAPVSYGTSGGGVYDADDGTLLGIVRGYRSAELAVPSPDASPVKIPIAGETTVVATPEIRRFLEAQKLEHLLHPVDKAPGSQ
jgi:S1-C subfamily serine protease